MPKQIRFITKVVVSIVLIFAGLFQPPASSSQQSPQTTTTAARNAALIAATADVLKETSEIRQLAILRPVQSSTQSRPEIEGDATLTMALYVANNPLRALLFLKSLGSTGMASQELDKAPRALRETLLFPYQQGTNWTRSLYKQAGWDRVSKAFTELPQSTEQILHPEKYFAHEAPVKVNLPDVHGLLGSKWKRIDYDVSGEWSYYLILDQFLNSQAESRRAAAGWGGDRYEIYEG